VLVFFYQTNKKLPRNKSFLDSIYCSSLKNVRTTRNAFSATPEKQILNGSRWGPPKGMVKRVLFVVTNHNNKLFAIKKHNIMAHTNMRKMVKIFPFYFFFIFFVIPYKFSSKNSTLFSFFRHILHNFLFFKKQS